jgi:AraC-like DNA-binding protein
MEYLKRLQRAIDYIDSHLEGDLHIEEAAREACYSRSHFIWIFRTATGVTPMEYVRRRKLTEAAAAILSGADIADTVYRFGFSAQDVFTRSFSHQFGLPPARFRKLGGAFARFAPALRLHSEGGSMKLSYNLDCQNERSIMRVETLLTDDRQYRFLMCANKFLTDSLGALLMGEISDPHLQQAAEEAGFISDGKPVVSTIGQTNGERCREIVRGTQQTVRKFVAARHADMEGLLASTLPGRQGVAADRMIVDLMRYVRMATHRRLYEDRFYTDSLPESGTITVFRDRRVEL